MFDLLRDWIYAWIAYNIDNCLYKTQNAHNSVLNYKKNIVEDHDQWSLLQLPQPLINLVGVFHVIMGRH